MVNITVLELHLEDPSFSADSPFSMITGADSAEQGDDEQPAGPDSVEDETGSVPTKVLAAVGAVLVLVGIAVVVKRLTGGEDPEVEIETPGDDENRPVGVTVDE